MLLRHNPCLTRIEILRFARHPVLSHRAYSAASTLPFSTPTRAFAKPRAHQRNEPPWHQRSQRRGAKKKSTLVLDDLPQGAIESNALPPQNDAEPEYPPLLQQVRNNMLNFSHCVLVTRVGGFYEVHALLIPLVLTH